MRFLKFISLFFLLLHSGKRTHSISFSFETRSHVVQGSLEFVYVAKTDVELLTLLTPFLQWQYYRHVLHVVLSDADHQAQSFVHASKQSSN